MTAGAMSDGSPVSPELDARLLADLREWRARLAPTSVDGNRWSARLTIDELDMLLRVAAERDALKAAAVAEWEADIPAEIRERIAEPAMRTPGVCSRCGGALYYSVPSHAWVHSGAVPPGCVPRPTPAESIPWPETMIRAHGHDGTATSAERARCPICNGIA